MDEVKLLKASAYSGFLRTGVALYFLHVHEFNFGAKLVCTNVKCVCSYPQQVHKSDLCQHLCCL